MKRPFVLTAAAALTIAGGIAAAPAFAQDPCDTDRPSLDCPTETPSPSPSRKPEPAKPTKPPRPEPAKPNPGTPARPVAPPTPTPPPATAEEAEAQRGSPDAAAAAAAAAQQALANAETRFAAVDAEYGKAQDALETAENSLASATGDAGTARAELGDIARETYMSGMDPGTVAKMAMLDAAPENITYASSVVESIGQHENDRVDHALSVLEAAEADVAKKKQALAAIQPNHDMASRNLTIARAAAGDGPAIADLGTFYSNYPVPECGFEREINTTRSCQEAMRFAIEQVNNPMKDWYYLCLNMVTIAYGAPETIPNAIDMWNTMPQESRHSPSEVAPPGALMFWSPNHVALSLGNNMLASVDVLGQGRVWIVSLDTIQAVWNMPYLGWTDPDFSQA